MKRREIRPPPPGGAPCLLFVRFQPGRRPLPPGVTALERASGKVLFSISCSPPPQQRAPGPEELLSLAPLSALLSPSAQMPPLRAGSRPGGAHAPPDSHSHWLLPVANPRDRRWRAPPPGPAPAGCRSATSSCRAPGPPPPAPLTELSERRRRHRRPQGGSVVLFVPWLGFAPAALGGRC